MHQQPVAVLLGPILVKRFLGAIGVIVITAGVNLQPSVANPAVTYDRLAGATRYSTAAAVAMKLWDEGGRRTNVATLARGDAFPDALAAANIGRMELLTPSAQLAPDTRDAMQQMHIADVTIVGGPAAISNNVEDELRAMGVAVQRVAGTDRYDTAVKTYFNRYSAEGDLPRQVNGKTTVMLASGTSFADAVAAGPLAVGANLPVLLTQRDTLPSSTRRAFADANGCPNGICIQRVIIVGGTSAVSDNVVQELKTLGVDVTRIAGPNRQATAAAIGQFAKDTLGWTMQQFNLARGDTFPDALAVAALGGAEHAPTLLTVRPDTLGSDTSDFLKANAATITSFHVIGDEEAVTEPTARNARAASTTP